MTRPNLIADRFIGDLYAWLTPDLLYHCFTGEEYPRTLAHIAKLQPSLQEPLLNKAERLWPQRLEQIAAASEIQKKQDKAAVHQFVIKLINDEDS
jgi:hypothetical protein